jgi:hypothetical protein
MALTFSASARLVRCIAYARLVCHPVHLPGFAAIVGVGLFEVRSVRVGVCPNEANIDELAVQCVCAVELAASVLELTDLRTRVHGAVFAVGPIDAPLVRLRVVEAQSQSLDVAAGVLRRGTLLSQVFPLRFLVTARVRRAIFLVVGP